MNEDTKRAMLWIKNNPERHKENKKRYCERNRERLKEEARIWRSNNKDYYKKYTEKYSDKIFNKTLKYYYNIDIKIYKQLKKKQNNKCAICKQKETYKIKGKTERLAVDHNHKTNEVRGLLCRRCNTGLGMFKDNPSLLKKAAKYLTIKGV